MEDVIHRAHQGSIAAIMQILNEQLRDAGITTRVAAPEKGVLRILCEAGHPENLDKNAIIRCIQKSLDEIAPRSFYDVYIQSHLTNDTQCLWVANLTQEARCKLLWSEKIQIKHRSLWQRFFPQKTAQSKGQNPRFRQRQCRVNYTTKVIIGTMLGTIACGGLGWIVYDWWQLKFRVPATSAQSHHAMDLQDLQAIAASSVSSDAFSQAVRLANQAALEGQRAATYGDWLTLANHWQQAADLMATVSEKHPRYVDAKVRVLSYRQNSEAALVKANVMAPKL